MLKIQKNSWLPEKPLVKALILVVEMVLIIQIIA